MFKKLINLIIELDRIRLRQKVEHQAEDQWIINNLVKKVRGFFEDWDLISYQITNISIHFNRQSRKYIEIMIFYFHSNSLSISIAS